MIYIITYYPSGLGWYIRRGVYEYRYRRGREREYTGRKIEK